jgi:D-glycero-D-manno-heptose 1,7-bisphosphate phosphatase
MKLDNFQNIFLDRDGVINEVIIRGNVISSPRHINEFKLRDEIAEFSERIIAMNKKIFIVSNQPDVSRGFLSAKELEKMDLIIRNKLDITDISYCLHDDSDDCNCRKPKPGMILSKIDSLNLLRNECVMIGDTNKDILAAKNAEIQSILLKKPYNQFIEPSVFSVDNLLHLL